MPETKDGRKHVYVHQYDRKDGGKTEHVPAHYRSNPTTSTGKAPAKKSGK